LRISLIGPTYPFRGGIAHYTTLLERALRQQHAVQFISFRRQYPSWLFPGQTDRDTSAKPLRADAVEYLLDPLAPWTWLQVARRVRHYRPKLVVLPWWVPFWAVPFRTVTASVKRFTTAKVIFICHNVLPHEAGGLDRLGTRLGLGQGDGFIAHSPEQVEQLLAIFPRATVRCVPHPTYAVFGTDRWTKEAARQELALNPEDRLLLFFGFVRPYKGLHHLLAAMPAILQQMEVTLLVVGEFWRGRAKTESQIAQLGLGGQVKLIDQYVPNEEIELFFAAADLVVLPYESATGSGILQIAMGLERPAVVTNVGGLAEIVVHGETGLVVPPRDSTALAEAIVHYFKEGLQPRFVENIRRSQTHFSWDVMVDAIETFEMQA
jgi:glycosyltransferase involved in cell wall biosynthesis